MERFPKFEIGSHARYTGLFDDIGRINPVLQFPLILHFVCDECVLSTLNVPGNETGYGYVEVFFDLDDKLRSNNMQLQWRASGEDKDEFCIWSLTELVPTTIDNVVMQKVTTSENEIISVLHKIYDNRFELAKLADITRHFQRLTIYSAVRHKRGKVYVEEVRRGDTYFWIATAFIAEAAELEGVLSVFPARCPSKFETCMDIQKGVETAVLLRKEAVHDCLVPRDYNYHTDDEDEGSSAA